MGQVLANRAVLGITLALPIAIQLLQESVYQVHFLGWIRLG